MCRWNDRPTILLLFSFSVVSTPMRLGGFYTAAMWWVAALPLGCNALLAAQGVNPGDPGPLFLAGVGLFNLVSNVPAVMLLLPHLASPGMGITLALVSSRHFLHATEQHVGSGVGVGYGHANPAHQRAESGVEPAGVREGQAKGRVGA